MATDPSYITPKPVIPAQKQFTTDEQQCKRIQFNCEEEIVKSRKKTRRKKPLWSQLQNQAFVNSLHNQP